MIVVDDDESGRALATCIRLARNPILLFVDAAVSLQQDELCILLDHLEDADIVSGCRQKRWSKTSLVWPIDRLLRGLFGVPFSDPFCPIKMRDARPLPG